MGHAAVRRIRCPGGLIILAEFPKTGLWTFGLPLGIDLIAHGVAWLGDSFLARARDA